MAGPGTTHRLRAGIVPKRPASRKTQRAVRPGRQEQKGEKGCGVENGKGRPGRGDVALPVLGGIAFLLLGLALMLWPEQVIALFPPAIGVVLILVGTLSIAHSLVLRGQLMEPQAKLLRGLVNVIVGVVFVARQDLSLAFLSILFGVYVLVGAAINFSAALQDRQQGRRWLPALGLSLLEFAMGVVLLRSLFAERLLWVRFLGLYFMLAAGGILLALLPGEKKADSSREKEVGGEPEDQ